MEPQTPPPLPEQAISTQSPDGEKNKRLAILCVAGFFFAICFAALGLLLVKNKNPQEKYAASQPATQSKQTPANITAADTPQNPPASQATSPAAKPTPAQTTSSQPADRYLQIPEWGIKLKYTAAGNYTLTYSLIDSATLYLSTNELASFAAAHPECASANRGTILNRLKPGDFDSYSGQQWDESRLQGILAVKVNGYYYVEFNNDVCSTQMQGVSFDVQQDFIGLDSKIPFNDSISAL